MSNEFQALMQLVGAACTGIPENREDDALDWNRIEKLASEQSVQTLVGYALRLCPEFSCPNEIRERMISNMRQAAFSNNGWKTGVLKLLSDLKSEGISAVLLKGYAIADCYHAPDCRVSGDTDILIDRQDEKRAAKLLRQKGFDVSDRWLNGHHAVCRHPLIGCVEMHVQLYDEIVEDVWFDKMHLDKCVKEEYRLVETSEGKYYTLGITDHFIFLVLHMVKHFIETGITIQMMTDVALYFRKYKAQIDLERFWTLIDELKYHKLVNCILWAMVRYAGFAKEDFPGISDTEPNEVEKIMNDLENGGWMGKNDKSERKQGWHEYNRQVILRNKSKLSYYIGMLRWNLVGWKTALFPSAERLKSKYPYAKRHPVLLPLAWLDRLIFRGTKAVKTGVLTRAIVTDEKQLSHAANERVQLFKDLDMM